MVFGSSRKDRRALLESFEMDLNGKQKALDVEQDNGKPLIFPFKASANKFISLLQDKLNYLQQLRIYVSCN